MVKFALGLFCLASFAAPALAQMDCQKFESIPPIASDKEVDTALGLSLFKGVFGAKQVPPLDGKLNIKVATAQHDVLSKYPNADMLALKQQELFYTCQLLNSDKSMPVPKKIQYLHAVTESLGTPKPVSASKPSVRAAHTSRNVAPSNPKNEDKNGSTASPIVSATNGIAIGGNNYGNNTVVNSAPIIPPLTVVKRIVAQQSPSASTKGRYVLVLSLTPNIRWEPVRVVVRATAPISEMGFDGLAMYERCGPGDDSGRVFSCERDNGASPSNPVQLIIYSNEAIRITGIQVSEAKSPR